MWSNNGGGTEVVGVQLWAEPELPQQAGREEPRERVKTEEYLALTSEAVPVSANIEVGVTAILERLKKEHDNAKAVKADDAEVPVYLWDCAVVGREPLDVEAKALATLWQFMMRVYCRRLWKDIRQHMARTFGKSWTTKIITMGDAPVHQSAAKEANAMREILWRATANDWFEYPAGSRLLFFRFPPRYAT
jgi:hypothetical protein